MTEPVGGYDWMSTIYSASVSLGSVSIGVLMRYAHAAQRAGEKIQWKRLRYEVFTVVGLTIIATPLSEYLGSKFGVSDGVLAATCLSLGYTGTRIFDFVETFLQDRSAKNEKADGKD